MSSRHTEVEQQFSSPANRSIFEVVTLPLALACAAVSLSVCVCVCVDGQRQIKVNVLCVCVCVCFYLAQCVRLFVWHQNNVHLTKSGVNTVFQNTHTHTHGHASVNSNTECVRVVWKDDGKER